LLSVCKLHVHALFLFRRLITCIGVLFLSDARIMRRLLVVWRSRRRRVVVGIMMSTPYRCFFCCGFLKMACDGRCRGGGMLWRDAVL